MLKSIVTSIVAVVIVSAVVFAITGGFGLFKDSGEELVYEERDSINTPHIQANLSKTESLFKENEAISSGVLGDVTISNKKLLDRLNKSDELLKEALKHPRDDEREILKGIIANYTKTAKEAIGEVNKKNNEELAYTISLTNRHILTWSPYFYYLHSETKSVLNQTIKLLETENQNLFEKLTDSDAELAGKLATERLKLIVEDLARSGRSRNSDFVIFSYNDYTEYRVFFDTLWQKNPDFKIGFAKNGYTLFNSFYNMHRDVDPEHNAEVRGWLKDMRINLINLHQTALREFAKKDREAAGDILNNIIEILKEQAEVHKTEYTELRIFIQNDLSSYTNLSI